ncbi:ribosome maturation factor RimM [Rothia sp. ZJ932]|uniref:ribosome maturation factor RimM n=1 Tax=Rothia sp. ZJ932 TaxID=2810516 RepID=UPI0019670DDA|nr:ribosome maturation factor RimM [Rothia sp. ZJ932]QRZ62351.1 ribosome maturation factor RimM [Rothia sp. ZJ932]
MQVLVARIGKPHGIRGEVTVQLFTDNPEERFAAGETLQIRDFDPTSPVGSLLPAGELTVASARWNKKILVVKFNEVTSRNDAEALRDSYLEFDSSTDTNEDSFYEHDLIGLPVYRIADVPEGELPSGDALGKVTGLQTMPTQDLLLFELAVNGEEVMIPFVEELVPELDLDEGFVLIDPPAGLIEMALDDEAPEDE